MQVPSYHAQCKGLQRHPRDRFEKFADSGQERGDSLVRNSSPKTVAQLFTCVFVLISPSPDDKTTQLLHLSYLRLQKLADAAVPAVKLHLNHDTETMLARVKTVYEWMQYIYSHYRKDPK